MRPSQTDVTPLLPPTVEFHWRTLDELESPPLRSGAAWWQSLRGERAYPTREEIKPRQMPALLPYMSLLRVIAGGADFEHRIVGDVMVRAFNVPIQNRRFSEIAIEAPGLIAQSFENFRVVVNTGAPLAWYSLSGRDSVNVVFTHAEIVLLPLGHGRVDHVLAFGNHWTCPSSA